MSRRAWSISRCDYSPGSRPGLLKVTTHYLGRVMATSYPDAIARACAKWPGERDAAKPNEGFSAERATR